MRDPLLASQTIGRRYFKVDGGLHYIYGNSSPHFAIGAEEGKLGARDCDACGCLHEEIEKRWPGRFSDLIALHLSDIDGAPMHAAENGWYYLTGTDPLFFSERYYLKKNDKDDPENARRALGEHLRVSPEEVAAILNTVRAAMAPALALHEHRMIPWSDVRAAGKEAFRALVEAMRPRWKAEADACRARHGLRVYGDLSKATPEQRAAWGVPDPEEAYRARGYDLYGKPFPAEVGMK